VSTTALTAVFPYLERYPELGGPVERVMLMKLPFSIGRADEADHQVFSNKVSKQHAVITKVDGRLLLRDLHSTNGTFVNGRRTSEHVLQDGDVIQLAHVEFCFRHPPEQPTGVDLQKAGGDGRTEMIGDASPTLRGRELVEDLMRLEAVDIVYQPIVDLKTRVPVGYEALARGRYPKLSQSPAILLRLAEQCGMEIELSQFLARLAVVRSTALPLGTSVFVNIHARQLTAPGFMKWLTALSAAANTSHPVVVEIAESSVTDVTAMVRYKREFSRLGLQFAYDDFGAGQSRLIELTDSPPDYLKLDMALVRDLDTVPARQEMMRALLNVMQKLGVRVIAEGIESEAVAEICMTLGCHLGQGYLFGAPA